VVLGVPAGFVGQIAVPREAKLAPRTTTHARASLFYAVAAALADGKVTMAHYTDDAIKRADLLVLAARMTHVETTWPDGIIRFCATVQITTRDGRTLRHTVDEAAGTGTRLLTAAEVEKKFRETVAGTLSETACEGIIGTVSGLADGASVSSILAATA